MKKAMMKRVLSLVLILILVCGMSVTAFAADMVSPLTIKIQVDGKASDLRAYSASYENNNFVCLRDVAYALSGTDKQFDITFDKDKGAVNLVKGQAYTAVGGEGQTGNRQVQWASSATAKLYVDGQAVKYAAYSVDGNTYMKFSDLMQAFDIHAVMQSGTITVDTAKAYEVSFNTLANNGYYSFLNGTVLGNAQTGQVLYANKEDNKVAIASTTKIMTYLLVKEAVDIKKISWDDEVVLTKNAEAQSASEDGVIPMKAGQKVKVSDLVNGMLIVSSNECATALAEHVAGSEAAFVAMMNKRAGELNLKSAEFYNPHGLPVYTADLFTAKSQNRMSAKDLFELARYTINKYPEILDITSKTELKIESLGFSDTNTNRLLFNVEGVDGLKTGSTNRAGSCLVVTAPIQHGDKTERVISVVLGAELTAECAEKSAVLIQYAKQYYAK